MIKPPLFRRQSSTRSRKLSLTSNGSRDSQISLSFDSVIEDEAWEVCFIYILYLVYSICYIDYDLSVIYFYL